MRRPSTASTWRSAMWDGMSAFVACSAGDPMLNACIQDSFSRDRERAGLAVSLVCRRYGGSSVSAPCPIRHLRKVLVDPNVGFSDCPGAKRRLNVSAASVWIDLRAILHGVRHLVDSVDHEPRLPVDDELRGAATSKGDHGGPAS